MPVTPRDLVQFAAGLTTQGTDEMSCRSAVSRAYYGAYHAAEFFHANLSSPGHLPQNPTGIHETLLHRLENPSISTSYQSHILSKQVGYKCRDLKRKREKADYQLNASVDLEEARYTQTHADRILNMIGL